MNTVAIVGRPNVGKSTLFNRIIGEMHSIVEDTPGVTRDRIYGIGDWNGVNFHLIDTGGFIPGSENTIEKAIREQAQLAIDEADAVIFLCDGRSGITPFDSDIAVILRNSGKPITLVINKCDNEKQDSFAYEFHSMGLGEPFPISSLTGRGTGDFLDDVVSSLDQKDSAEEDTRLKIAIVGRPNSGKSSITNALLGENRSIVTDIAGTTRDAIDAVLKYHGEEILLIDTAGLRKRAQVKENIELYSILRTTRAIDRCDVAIVVIDAERGLEDQDKKIINMVNDARKGMIFAVNKWDLIEKDHRTADQLTKLIKEKMKTFDYAPVYFVSAVTKQRIIKLVEEARRVKERRMTRITTSRLNNNLLPELERTPPPAVRAKDLRINYITQVNTEPPVFAFFCNFPQLIPDSYKRFIERRLRDLFDFEGTPISFVFRKKNKSYEDLE